jgi:hypothetical protein
VEEEVQGKTRIFSLFFGNLPATHTSHEPRLGLLNRNKGMNTSPIILSKIRILSSVLLGFL